MVLQIPVTVPEQVNDLYNVESREKFLQELSIIGPTL